MAKKEEETKQKSEKSKKTEQKTESGLEEDIGEAQEEIKTISFQQFMQPVSRTTASLERTESLPEPRLEARGEVVKKNSNKEVSHFDYLETAARYEGEERKYSQPRTVPTLNSSGPSQQGVEFIDPSAGRTLLRNDSQPQPFDVKQIEHHNRLPFQGEERKYEEVEFEKDVR